MRSAVTCAVLLLLTAGWATGQSPEPPTDVQDSTCYSCHKPGGEGGGKSLVSLFRIDLANGTRLQAGNETTMALLITNQWSARLERIEVVLDISEAPSLGFSGRPAPILDQVQTGTLTGWQQDPFAESRSWTGSFDLPAGGTDLRIAVRPDTTAGELAPDLKASLWRPGSDRVDPPDLVLDAAAAGQPEGVHVSDDPVPSGAWTVEVEQAGWPSAPLDRSRMVDQRFSLSWDLWFNVSEADPVRLFSVADVLDGDDEEAPQALQVPFPIALLEPLERNETLAVRVELDAYHDHVSQARAGDRARFFREATFTLAPPAEPDAPVVVMPPAPIQVEAVQAAEPMRWDLYGEMLGYATAGLVAVSLVTGGTFGRWTRRVQDWVARDRRRRRLHHMVTGHAILLAAVGHATLFALEPRYGWSVGWLLGGIAIIAIVALGLTGVFQRPMTRRLGAEAWRWMHFVAAAACVVAIGLHIVLDGVHFAHFQEELGWSDPLAPRLEAWVEGAPTEPPAGSAEAVMDADGVENPPDFETTTTPP